MMESILVMTLLVVLVPSAALAQRKDNQAVRGAPKIQVERELMKLERDWMEALKRRDGEALRRIQADDFIYSVGEGRFGTKADAQSDLQELDLDSISSQVLTTRVYGRTAVVTLRGAMKGTFRGVDISGSYVETAVWVKRDGRWQVVSAHLSRFVGQ